MQMGRVIGSVWATRKEEGLNGLKLLIIQPIDSNQQPIRTEMVAADRIGAGIGDDVLITSGGSSRYIMKENPLPIDAVVIGIIDSTEVMRGEDNE
ncbi:MULTISPECIES: EutN/CcmL family microcompartment protein [Lysinibacillus]|jgi:ethanolamine utilization protein EutN|uniref:Ethanolamine utilization protein EutN n=1 Tax=Lysinibacillus fusiformis TaxID=28031 RepID=A0A2I0V3H1_9BACI|nr:MULTISPECIES: EutN/CcmL family microcompartment protein [Lysinibacillus]KUF29294.1 ethanolamine utilization protein EutN [Lysinibacillus sp. F5]MEE3808774.1 EutN/CcmL family microcompartment protein [Lysinibacillus fusiformis]PKU52772.1 ethanolamine utilization protein EutN [Lysinibacillus fusiformis]QSB08753.1 EutN/CcmL family microcompartment protein [Lysinibacillus fusiformis]WCH49271.1 EutN/CcmL family microcompartment protein [Lysinibacillus sp. OF-1]